MECKAVGFVLLEKSIVLAGMNNRLASFYLKGKKNFAI
jgi:hypothetical protein